jgi:hypothetical protein
MSSIAFHSIWTISAATSIVSSLRCFRVLANNFTTSAMTSEEEKVSVMQNCLGSSEELTCKSGLDYELKDVHKSSSALCKTHMPLSASFPCHSCASIAPQSRSSGVPEDRDGCQTQRTGEEMCRRVEHQKSTASVKRLVKWLLCIKKHKSSIT